jgi:hypothetical protein
VSKGFLREEDEALMEISLINSDTIPNKKNCRQILREKVEFLQVGNDGNKKDAMMIILGRGERTSALEKAWRHVCRERLHKRAHTKIRTHELGKTMWLWYE